jgi:hypothetical protein
MIILLEDCATLEVELATWGELGGRLRAVRVADTDAAAGASLGG